MPRLSSAKIKAERAEQDQIIADQHEQIKQAEAEQVFAGIVVSHEKAQYKVLAPKFSYEGTEYKAEDLKTNKDLVKELIEIKSGILEKVSK